MNSHKVSRNMNSSSKKKKERKGKRKNIRKQEFPNGEQHQVLASNKMKLNMKTSRMQHKSQRVSFLM